MSDHLGEIAFKPMNAGHVRQILTWRYEPPYDIYNMGRGTADPVELAEALDYFLQEKYRFRAMVRQPERELVAFCSFGQDGQVGGGDYRIEALDIGLGVEPSYTGRGLGGSFVGLVIDYAQKTFSPTRLRVTIAEFNRRAQKVWERHKFVPQQRFRAQYGGRPFIIYTRDL